MLKTIGTMAVDAGLNIGQSLFNHNIAEQAAEKAYQRQLDFWHRQNSYNSPRAQRDRFVQAGMNPSAVMGEIASGQTAQQLSTVPQNEFAQSGILKLNGLAETMEVLARIEKMGAETKLLSEQGLTEIIRQTLLAMGIPEKDIDIAIKGWEEKSEAKKYERIDEYIDAEINRIQSQGNESQANADATNKKLPFEIGKITSEISLNEMTTILRDAESKESKAAAANQYAHARLANLNADITAKYGDAKAAAELKDAQTKADYCAALLQSSLDLQSSVIMLNQNQAITNDARVVIEQQAQDLKERYLEFEKDQFELEKNKFELEAVKAAVDAVTKIIDTSTPW